MLICAPLELFSARPFDCCLLCGGTGIKSHCDSSESVKIPIVRFFLFRTCFIHCAAIKTDQTSLLVPGKPDKSGATAEERQNNQNAGLEGEEFRPESRPLLQETQPGMTKHSPPLEDEDRGLGDSLPNTTNSSQTSLSGLPTLTFGTTPRPSPPAVRIAPADVVRRHYTSLPLLC